MGASDARIAVGKAIKNGGHLGAVGLGTGLDRVCRFVHPVDQPFGTGPLEGCLSVIACGAAIIEGEELIGIGEAHIVAKGGGIAIEHSGHILSGDGILGAEHTVAVAVDDFVLGGPVDCGHIPALGEIVEFVSVYRGRAFQTPEDRGQHSTARGAVGLEIGAACAAHQGIIIAEFDIIVIPVSGLDIVHGEDGGGIVFGDPQYLAAEIIDPTAGYEIFAVVGIDANFAFTGGVGIGTKLLGVNGHILRNAESG